jgi:hypothetical protein
MNQNGHHSPETTIEKNVVEIKLNFLRQFLTVAGVSTNMEYATLLAHHCVLNAVLDIFISATGARKLRQ